MIDDPIKEPETYFGYVVQNLSGCMTSTFLSKLPVHQGTSGEVLRKDCRPARIIREHDYQRLLHLAMRKNSSTMPAMTDKTTELRECPFLRITDSMMQAGAMALDGHGKRISPLDAELVFIAMLAATVA